METVICNTKGEARGNPGAAAIAVLVVDGEVITEIGRLIGNANAHFAEYYAVMVGLQTLQTLYGEQTKDMHFELRLSNVLVQRQLTAQATINEPGLVPMFIEIHNMRVESFPNLLVTQVTQEENTLVQQLLNEALDGKA
jgi:ribonuclease HI